MVSLAQKGSQELIQFSTLPRSIIIIMSKSIQISYLKVSYSAKNGP